MPGYDGLMRIFWPADIARSEFPGVIVGWRNSELDVFVVAVLDVADVGVPVIAEGDLTLYAMETFC